MGEQLYKISAYVNAEELRQFKLWVKARGLTESMYIREMLGFDIRRQGAPPGPRKKKIEPKNSKSKKA